MAKKKNNPKLDPALEAFNAGYQLLTATSLFTPLRQYIQIVRHQASRCPLDGWAIVTNNGVIHVHPTRRAAPEEWQYILAHCLLHLAFQHFREYEAELFVLWNTACDCFIARFLEELKIGKAPIDITQTPQLPAQSEEALFRYFRENDIPEELHYCGTTGPAGNDMFREPPRNYWRGAPPDWPRLFGQGITLAVSSAVAEASNIQVDHKGNPINLTMAERSRRWFIASYPLLGALAASFEIIEDQRICHQMEISVAAVNAEMKEIYINPAVGLSQEEHYFVMAHEILHVGLRHEIRCQGRDPYLWNIACDYVINSWLIEMGIGVMPSLGALYDEKLKGLSAETIYDQIVTNLRLFRKLSTLRGKGLGDVLGGRPGWWSHGDGVTLDEFYRRCLAQGLEYHQSQGRGLLPAGLVEEIQALSQPPIPWDVELARWFDEHFAPMEKRRSYARPSRRQSATPEIPRPSWTYRQELMDNRTFGVILDTSGSMDRSLLAKALGAIASYSLSREVPLVRVIFCDATYYDQGYIPPEVIANRVKVRGRGGTILQPAIDFLERVEDFPKDGPLLIITDGYCDNLHLPRHRDHAFLLPKGRFLPFAPKGKVFYIE
jgi:predicted metal-dependent peptidase